MSSSGPAVSVILPTYNGAGYVGKAIASILAQTFTDFELIVLNDGSTDSTADEVNGFVDSRLRYVYHANRGLAATLNRGIELARGKYLARQDHDDLSMPLRLAKQIEYMEAHPQCALLGSWARVIEGDRETERYYRYPAESGDLLAEMMFRNPFVHTSVMIRRSALDHTGVYSTDPQRQPPEDYELWARIAKRFEVANLQEALVWYRELPTSMSHHKSDVIKQRFALLLAEHIGGLARVDDLAPLLPFTKIIIGREEAVDSLPEFKRIAPILYVAGDHITQRSGKPSGTYDPVIRRQLQLAEFRYFVRNHGAWRGKWLRYAARLAKGYSLDRSLSVKPPV